jgi:hypothetical protein
VKKETALVIFYVLYFAWLLVITYFSRDTAFINYFTLGVAFFYFVFLREPGDIFIFLAVITGMYLFKVYSVETQEFMLDYETLSTIPAWIPLAWGTSAIALKKLYSVLRK